MTDIKHSNLSAIKILKDGEAKQTEEHQAREQQKLGTLRGGNSGALIGIDVVGKCHRKTLARFLGYDAPKGEYAPAFFEMGFANEAVWEEKIKKGWPHNVRLEEEYPVRWEVKDIDGNPVPVTGRPDLVIFDDQDQPVLVFELKAIGAWKSTLGVYFENTPKTEHLIQCAHYCMEIGAPGTLVYTCNMRAAMPYWVQKKWGCQELQPFKKEFKVGFDGGQVYYITDTGTRVDTKITEQGIRNYYQLIVDMRDNNVLYSRIAAKDLQGKMMPYNPCDYCEFKSACDQYEDDYSRWVDEIALICGEDE